MKIIGALFILAGFIYYFATRIPFSVGNIMFAGVLIVIGILMIFGIPKKN